MAKSKHPKPWEKAIIHLTGYKDVESNKTEASPRAVKSIRMDHMEVREIDDPTELGMKWNAKVKLVFKIINSPDGKVSV